MNYFIWIFKIIFQDGHNTWESYRSNFFNHFSWIFLAKYFLDSSYTSSHSGVEAVFHLVFSSIMQILSDFCPSSTNLEKCLKDINFLGIRELLIFYSENKMVMIPFSALFSIFPVCLGFVDIEISCDFDPVLRTIVNNKLQ